MRIKEGLTSLPEFMDELNTLTQNPKITGIFVTLVVSGQHLHSYQYGMEEEDWDHCITLLKEFKTMKLSVH